MSKRGKGIPRYGKPKKLSKQVADLRATTAAFNDLSEGFINLGRELAQRFETPTGRQIPSGTYRVTSGMDLGLNDQTVISFLDADYSQSETRVTNQLMDPQPPITYARLQEIQERIREDMSLRERPSGDPFASSELSGLLNARYGESTEANPQTHEIATHIEEELLWPGTWDAVERNSISLEEMATMTNVSTREVLRSTARYFAQSDGRYVSDVNIERSRRRRSLYVTINYELPVGSFEGEPMVELSEFIKNETERNAHTLIVARRLLSFLEDNQDMLTLLSDKDEFVERILKPLQSIASTPDRLTGDDVNYIKRTTSGMRDLDDFGRAVKGGRRIRTPKPADTK